jgi:hypothetical protein
VRKMVGLAGMAGPRCAAFDATGGGWEAAARSGRSATV